MHASETAPSIPGRGDIVAGKYLVINTLGEGGMAVVLRAYHVRLRQFVAIKVLQPKSAADPEMTSRFEREAHVMSQLDGVNAVTVYDVDHLPNGLPYMVLEYLEGNDLAAELDLDGALPFSTAVDVAHQALGALVKVHAAGIIHRDLKPSNLFLCKLGEEMKGRRLVKIVDFGISKFETGEESHLTKPLSVFGTPHYMSPAQLRSTKQVDARADLWSLGVILYELVTGRTPFTGSTTAVIAAIAHDDIPPPRQFRPDTPAELEAVIVKALARDPDLGFQTASDFRRALQPMAPAVDISTALAELNAGTKSRRAAVLPPDLEGILRQHALERPMTPASIPMLRVTTPGRDLDPSSRAAAAPDLHATQTKWESHPPAPAAAPTKRASRVPVLLAVGGALALAVAAAMALPRSKAESVRGEAVSAAPSVLNVPPPSVAVVHAMVPDPVRPEGASVSPIVSSPTTARGPRVSAPPPAVAERSSSSPATPKVAPSASAAEPLRNPNHL